MSSLLITFNTPWGKYRWLRLPFGLKIASDVFQERLDRELRLLEGVHGIADDILTHGKTEVEHDGRLLILLETAHMNNLSLNPKKIQFKSQDCKFFGHRLTPEGIKPDPEKVKAIVEMKPPGCIQTLLQWNCNEMQVHRFFSSYILGTDNLRHPYNSIVYCGSSFPYSIQTVNDISTRSYISIYTCGYPRIKGMQSNRQV